MTILGEVVDMLECVVHHKKLRVGNTISSSWKHHWKYPVFDATNGEL